MKYDTPRGAFGPATLSATRYQLVPGFADYLLQHQNRGVVARACRPSCPADLGQVRTFALPIDPGGQLANPLA